MKKLLSLLICLALLLSFAPLAVANTLQVQGEALLRGTLAVFATGEFTLRGEGWTISQRGSARAYDFGETLFGWRFHYIEGYRSRRVTLVFPDRQLYLHSEAFFSVSNTAHSNWSWNILFNSSNVGGVQVAQVRIDGNTYIRVLDGGLRAFYYHNGQLRRVAAAHWGVTGDTTIYMVNSLTRGADDSLLDLYGMRRITPLLPFARQVRMVDDVVHGWLRR